MTDDEESTSRLPDFFVQEREKLYYYGSQLDKVMWNPNPENTQVRDQMIDAYLDTVLYVTARIIPSLEGDNLSKAKDIYQYAKTYYHYHRDDMEAGLPTLNRNHEQLTRILKEEGYDDIQLDVLELT